MNKTCFYCTRGWIAILLFWTSLFGLERFRGDLLFWWFMIRFSYWHYLLIYREFLALFSFKGRSVLNCFSILWLSILKLSCLFHCERVCTFSWSKLTLFVHFDVLWKFLLFFGEWTRRGLLFSFTLHDICQMLSEKHSDSPLNWIVLGRLNDLRKVHSLLNLLMESMKNLWLEDLFTFLIPRLLHGSENLY